MLDTKMIIILTAAIFIIGCASPSSDQVFQSPDGDWSTSIQTSASWESLGTMTFSGINKASYTYRGGRILFDEIDDAGLWKGHWIEDTWSAVICPQERDGSKSWGQAIFQFNETYTRFRGTYDLCGEGRKNSWDGRRN